MDPDFDAAVLDALFTQPPVGLQVMDRGLRIVRINTAAPGLRGLDPRKLLGRTWRELGLIDAETEERVRRVLDTGEPIKDLRYRGRLPGTGREVRLLSITAFRIHDRDGNPLGVAATTIDITERDNAERRLDLLYRAGVTIGSTLDVFRTAQELADVAAPEMADAAVVDVLDSVLHGEAPAPGPVTAPITVRRAGSRVAGTIAQRDPIRVGDVRVMPYATPFAGALGDLRPRLVRELGPDDIRIARDPRWAELLREAGAHSLMAVPLTARGVVLGIAAFYRLGGSDPFDEADLELAADLVARAAVCVDNARRYTREHTLARLTQRTLVPARLPAHTALETAYAYLPVASGGAWYDVLPLSGARVALVAGDVSGHGMGAVTTMGRLRTAVGAFAAMDLRPDALLARLDDLTVRLGNELRTMGGDEPLLTASCVYAVYDPATGACALSRAGHPPPVLVRPDGHIQAAECPDGPVLGRGAGEYTTKTVRLPAGTILAFQNQGLPTADQGPATGTRAPGPAHGPGGAEARFAPYRSALSPQGAPLQELCDRLLAALLPDDPQDDALVLMARTRILGSDSIGCWTLPNEPASAAVSRRLVTGLLTAWGLDDLGFGTELIASELVTNAVRYSSGDIGLRLIRDTALICEVSDTSTAAPHLRHADDDDEGGRGLDMVAHISRRWGTRLTSTGKAVWTEQELPGPSRQPGEGGAERP
ncbi:SpoIIE family protein phosphatase [Streptomyces sp. NPDC127084]|uniref:SpoIIE family protein phosphatase n=1 Tax=Streptomyces sp. NPDC127084 TaxID=3347133 RepID=UPI00364CAF76